MELFITLHQVCHGKPAAFRVNQDFNAANVSVSQTIVIDGAVRFDSDTGQIRPVFINATPVTLTLPSPGDYSIRFEDSQGAELARFSFNPASDGDFSPIGMISLLLPYDTNTKRIVLLHNETVLASRLASVNPPERGRDIPDGSRIFDGSSAGFYVDRQRSGWGRLELQTRVQQRQWPDLADARV